LSGKKREQTGPFFLPATGRDGAGGLERVGSYDVSGLDMGAESKCHRRKSQSRAKEEGICQEFRDCTKEGRVGRARQIVERGLQTQHEIAQL